ncbi:spermidine/putrescine ABC transporter ATP-binding protein [Candidatus Xianfuyuplasma coldseepsis]|uniref:Spermidine/putrescine import ATP-binding protein PotA n=1 Tax=Candidatus Xianfuyuplasma coldseepsis TaxID=2782163 RepID=A0A7L7KS85_9MOLU|nr:spermidine/putrescine ABC transporter ATP-binding protein [Xianfuyuplasma coldseepsis]QMS85681.1 ABC transporter ATP-binding protein [Xianfuyuplasma coldseepsis]
MANKLVDLKHITKSFDDNVVLNDVSLYIKENEFVTLLGPSGCGKTTLLRIIGGFESLDHGAVVFDGKDILDTPPYEREINTVFQNYALFPHLNVFHNVAFGLHIKKLPKDEVQEKVLRALKMVKLSGYEERPINTLSGGQQQRVAIARAIVNEPKLLLLDEPLGSLDLKLRQEMQYELKEIQRNLGISFIFVTHDQEEALTMSDVVVVMKDGVIQQIGRPEDIYNEPKNRFTANFIGESNIIEGTMKQDYLVHFEGLDFECVDHGFETNEPIDVVIRPEDILIQEPQQGLITGTVDDMIFKGVHYEITVLVNEKEYIIHSTDPVTIGDEVSLAFDPDEIHVMKRTYETLT